uniref:V-type ATP synthase subunit D n=1 Tax=Angiostrongylus cantonensis TaxID=6313 RepID=A0A0K0D6P7_ANGCA
LSVVTPGNANEQKVAAGFTSASEIDKHRVGRAELKGEVDSYIRMRTRFYNLQLALLKLKKRLVSAPTQVAKVKKLVAAANEDYESAIGQANSWLEYQVPQVDS